MDWQIKKFTGLAGWIYRAPLRGVIFILLVMLTGESIAIVVTAKWGYKQSRALLNCQNEKSESEEKINDLLIKLVSRQNNVNLVQDSVVNKNDSVLQAVHQTISVK